LLYFFNMKMNDDFSRLEALVSQWAVETGIHTKSGSTDKNKYSEYIAAELLNAAFPFRLKVLGKNHPAVDLGDQAKGIAFQITSRTDAHKIRSNLQTFKDKNLTSKYPGGIRFLLLVSKKEDWSSKIKKSFTEILKGFDADKHIYTLTDVIQQLKTNYLTNSGPFLNILSIMEWQFGNKAVEPPLSFIRQMLIQGSQSYHQALTGENGRFRRLHIEDLLLTRPDTETEWVPQPVSIEEGKNSSHTHETVITLLPRLWNRSCEHAVIVGEGGIGKTVSLVRLWKTYLDLINSGSDEPIPVFIALNEFNHRTNSTGDFILSRVAKNYLDDERLKTVLNKLLKARGQRVDGIKVPSVVLLLDGFNEITVDKQELLLELNHLVEQCPGIQVVITSRLDMRGNFNWGHWNLVRLKELEADKVKEYLQVKGMAVPGQERLRGLIKNPMMLTLYAASCEVQENQRYSRYCCFKDTVESPGELLWNFIEAQVAKLPDRVGLDEAQVVYYWFLLKYLLPGLGYEMEKAGLFAFTYAQFQERLDHLCRRFSQDDFLDTFPQFGKYEDMLPLGECADGRDRRKRAARLRDIFCSELHMLVEEGQLLRFLHQDFRDFFAAVHLLNEAEISLIKGEIPGVFKERLLDYFVRRLVGEIEGEHRVKPFLEANAGWNIYIPVHNRLHRVLELCRGKFGAAVGDAVRNIVMIWIEVRVELSGADLSGLDLSGIPLNGVRCSRVYEDRYLAAVFAGSRVHEKNLLPRGHSSLVNSAVYSPDGKKILSASDDRTIKEWDAGTGQCVKTMSGHTMEVASAMYSPDGKKILSASWDNTIKEWDAGTGECVKTLASHTSLVNSTIYSPDGEKILSASSDQTIKEWDVGTGQCVKTLTGHTDGVNSAVYSPDGEKILSASRDHTIKEWDAGTGQCVKTLPGYTSVFTSAVYSPDGEKILSASRDQTIKEWDVETGECMKTLAGHTCYVYSAVYSPDGKKILSASGDNTIKEWDAGTGECVKTLTGHTDGVNSAVYSPDGKKILSASRDPTIKEWNTGIGECVKTMAGHENYVNSAVYSPDGKKILSASWDPTIKEWNAGTRECVKTLAGHTDMVTSAVYSLDGKKILSSDDQTIKEWDAATGKCLKTHQEKDNPQIPGYPPKEKIVELKTAWNIIYVPDASAKGKEWKLFNIPGLFIQGCSFQNLEKGSEWSEEGIKILRQYHASVSVDK
jgi:WD40 repeat protein